MSPLEQWIEALRSGHYHQTTGRLNDGFGMCCLGVASDLYPHGAWTDLTDGFGYTVYGEEEVFHSSANLIDPVRDWLGIEGVLVPWPLVERLAPDAASQIPPENIHGDHYKHWVELTTLNDERVSFDEIANIVEAYWVKGEMA